MPDGVWPWSKARRQNGGVVAEEAIPEPSNNGVGPHTDGEELDQTGDDGGPAGEELDKLTWNELVAGLKAAQRAAHRAEVRISRHINEEHGQNSSSIPAAGNDNDARQRFESYRRTHRRY